MIFMTILKNAIQIKKENLDCILIFDMLDNKKLNLIVSELFIRCKKLNIFLVFITQSYFAVPKNIRLKSTHHFIMKVRNKQELQQISFIHSSNIDFKEFLLKM